jgi:cytochrome oxidase assembly protein ShyY1
MEEKMNRTATRGTLGGASVGRRLGFGFGALLLLIIFMASLGSWQLGSLTAVTERIVTVDTHT